MDIIKNADYKSALKKLSRRLRKFHSLRRIDVTTPNGRQFATLRDNGGAIVLMMPQELANQLPLKPQ